jgi:hypothetical protein
MEGVTANFATSPSGTGSFAAICVVVAAGLAYSRAITAAVPPGASRLILLLPVVVCNVVLPFICLDPLQDVMVRAVTHSRSRGASRHSVGYTDLSGRRQSLLLTVRPTRVALTPGGCQIWFVPGRTACRQRRSCRHLSFCTSKLQL